ncbi:MAG: dihydrofolate reductase [Myxococcota bacterium]|jgi:dihydrofolate reductase
MSDSSRVRVYMACSLDGFIAGPDDDLSWLEPPADAPPPTGGIEFEPFMAQIGVMIMGRRTHDVVAGFGQWAYGETPVLVATRRPLTPAAPTVRAVSGDIAAIIEQARAVAGEKDIYLDGGDLIRQALNAGLIDELIITIIPILLGDGIRLFDGIAQRTSLEFVAHHAYGHMAQIVARPVR